jgi:hypothetical protein
MPTYPYPSREEVQANILGNKVQFTYLSLITDHVPYLDNFIHSYYSSRRNP